MNFQAIKSDSGAALVGALATLPQAIAYGLIAVSPLGPEWSAFGIAASVGTAIAFGMFSGAFTGNPFLISGPSAVTALVLATGINAGLERGHTAETALVLGFLGVVASGVFQVAAGFLRLGHMVAYLPVPVLVGFVNASAILVFLSSLPMLFGVPALGVAEIFGNGFENVSLWALCVGGVTILTNLALDGRLRLIPAALMGLIIGTALYYLGLAFFGQEAGPTVGAIDVFSFLDHPVYSHAGIVWDRLAADADIPLLMGLSLGLLASFNTVLISSALDVGSDTESNPNRDLKIHGVGNALMGFAGFLPGAGTLSRSKSIIQSGAVSRAANIGVGVALLLMLFVLAPLTALLSMWATAGMLVATAIQALDRPTLEKIWTVLTRRTAYPEVYAGDLLVSIAVVVTAVTFDLIAAVGVGTLLAAVLFILGMGRDPIRRTYSAVHVHSKVQRPYEQTKRLEEQGHRIAIIEMQGALFFGACAKLNDTAKRLISEGATHLILDFRHLTSIDSTGSSTVLGLQTLCAEAGGKLLISRVDPERRLSRFARHNAPDGESRRYTTPPRWIWLNLNGNGVFEAIGEQRIFDDTERALAYCEDLVLSEYSGLDKAGAKQFIAESGLFADLSRDDILTLGGYATRRVFAPGQVVFNQGDAGDTAYFVLSGSLDVFISIPGSTRQRRVSVVMPGTVFGEMGLLDGEPRSAGVAAETRAVCFALSVDAFERLQSDHPRAAMTLLRNLNRQFSQRLRVANAMISELER